MLVRFVSVVVTVAVLVAQNANPPRSIPPQGVKISEADKADLLSGLERLQSAMEGVSGLALLSDVRIFHEAVRVAVTYDEFFRAEDVAKAKDLLRQGLARTEELKNGRASWTTATGLVVRGYLSKLDRSVQPYGLVIPASFNPQLPRKWRLDLWLHGRSENLNEITFLTDRQRSAGEFTPPDTFVVHLYGRYNNANKFAGERDVFEALADVKQHYPIDENRILVRGFSMGGASTWHLAAHHAGEWAAAAPGAGFSETPEYTRIMQDAVKPTAWEQKLWHWYSATDYAANLFNVPVVAYSGEIDKQKQAADMMDKAMTAEGMRLTHVIGPQTAHKYHPDSKLIINRKLDAIAEQGRDPYPRRIRFTTWTLRYNRMKWITVDALGKHWERARLDAEVTAENTIKVKAENVTAFTIDLDPGSSLLEPAQTIDVVVNGQPVKVAGTMSDRSFAAALQLAGTRWTLRNSTSDPELRKRHGLQGPIDDAFMDSFIFVRPTGQAMNPGLTTWVAAEQARAIREWRRHFRGEPQVRDDSQITEDDIASSNLVLWGDPGSNSILARLIAKLPLQWAPGSLAIGASKAMGAAHVPVLIYPNPLNPQRYVVVNSGITYREADYSTNAREVPKLPDWAIVDTSVPPDTRHPGRIVAADFFDERWQPFSK